MCWPVELIAQLDQLPGPTRERPCRPKQTIVTATRLGLGTSVLMHWRWSCDGLSLRTSVAILWPGGERLIDVCSHLRVTNEPKPKPRMSIWIFVPLTRHNGALSLVTGPDLAATYKTRSISKLFCCCCLLLWLFSIVARNRSICTTLSRLVSLSSILI